MIFLPKHIGHIVFCAKARGGSEQEPRMLPTQIIPSTVLAPRSSLDLSWKQPRFLFRATSCFCTKDDVANVLWKEKPRCLGGHECAFSLGKKSPEMPMFALANHNWLGRLTKVQLNLLSKTYLHLAKNVGQECEPSGRNTTFLVTARARLRRSRWPRYVCESSFS